MAASIDSAAPSAQAASNKAEPGPGQAGGGFGGRGAVAVAELLPPQDCAD